MTSRWQFVLPEGYDKEKFLNEKGVIYALWHNRLSFGPRIFKGQKETAALVSPHSDGKIISSIISKFGFKIIEGSTNKNSVGALKQIITKLSSGSNIVITPDGPRGPVYKVNSSITEVAKKYEAKLVPITAIATHYFVLKTWDRLIMPLPFSSVIIMIGQPLILLDDAQSNNALLEQSLMKINEG